MAIAAYFTPKSMNATEYSEALRRLEQAGAGQPAGRLYHVCFGEGDRLQVVDIWDSIESFQQFGQTLMPILGEIGIDPGEPKIQPVHNTIAE
jgi:hypothetical protein